MSTTGKIFKESGNIYQDEAKILFNYYQVAAERITAEEERIEQKIRQYREDKALVEQNMSKLWIWFLTIIAFWMYWVKKNEALRQIAEIDAKIDEQAKAYENIFRDYKVTKLGVAYVPVADQIKYDDKSFMVDYTGSVPQSQVKLQMSRQNQLLASTIAQLNSLSEQVPVVERSDEPETIATDQYSLSIQEVTQSDYVGKMDRSMRTIAFCMNDLETSSVELPLVPDNSEYLAYVKEYATNKVPEGTPVIDVFDKERYAPSVNAFQHLNKLKDSLSSETQRFEDVLESLITTVAHSVQTISALKLSSTDKMINSSNALLFKILKAPYNHYSPVLEAEEIQRIRQETFDYSDSVQGYDPFTLRESSRVRYNLLTDLWVAEDGSVSAVPFGVHQIYEEIVAPVVQNLMAENRIERLKIYNQIHDQKVSYVNKWHQDVDAFYRSNHAESADIINNMQKTLSEYIEAYNTLAQLKKTENSMRQEGADLDAAVVKEADASAEIVMAFEMQASEFKAVQDDFTDYMDRLQDDIAQRAEEFGHVEYFDARLRDGHSNEMAVAAGEVASLDDRRKPLCAANPLLAKSSDLPPAPSVEDVTYEDLSMNLNAIAANALQELDDMMTAPAPEPEAPAAEPSGEEVLEAEAVPQEEAPATADPGEEAPATEEPASDAPEEEAPAAPDDEEAPEETEAVDEDEEDEEDEEDDDEDEDDEDDYDEEDEDLDEDEEAYDDDEDEEDDEEDKE